MNVFALQRLKFGTTYNSGKRSTFPSIFGAVLGLPTISGVPFSESQVTVIALSKRFAVNSFLVCLLEPDLVFFQGKTFSHAFLYSYTLSILPKRRSIKTC